MRPVLAIGLALVAVLASTPSADAADPSPDRRVTVAVFGDSVVEGYTTPGYQRNSLIPRLREALAARGLARGGEGFIPVAPERWEMDWVLPHEPRPAAGWTLLGLGGLPAGDGPSAFGVTTRAPRARASTPVRDPEVTLLYTTTRGSTPFRVTLGGRVHALDARAPGPPRPGAAVLDVPPGARTLTVHGPSAGELRLSGAVARRPPPAGGVQVEVHNLGHAGRFPQLDNTPRVLRAIAEQRYDVTVFAWGYNSELALGWFRRSDLAARYEPALLRRARLARAGGGECVIADSTPLPVPPSVPRRFAAMHRRVARRAGCTYTGALARLWSAPATAHRRGLTQADRVHPSPSSYRRMARALAPVVERAVRRRAAAG